MCEKMSVVVAEKSDDHTTMRAADELQDEILFQQPESTHLGDCPICSLPLSLDINKSYMMACCSKHICGGCYHASRKRESEERLVDPKCAFCRTNLPKTEEERVERMMKRIEANDPRAICDMGNKRVSEGDHKAAFEYYTKAAALGDAFAHFQLSCMYRNGTCVEKDEKKELQHLKEAAIGGQPDARHNLGCMEMEKGRRDRAVKHFIIAAKLGHDGSLNCVMHLCVDGHVSRDDVDATLLGHKNAIDATQSHERDLAEVYEMRLAKRDRS